MTGSFACRTLLAVLLAVTVVACSGNATRARTPLDLARSYSEKFAAFEPTNPNPDLAKIAAALGTGRCAPDETSEEYHVALIAQDGHLRPSDIVSTVAIGHTYCHAGLDQLIAALRAVWPAEVASTDFGAMIERFDEIDRKAGV